MFRFTIRDLFWAIAAVALCLTVYLGFQADRVALIKRAKQAEQDALEATEMLLGPPIQRNLQQSQQTPIDAPPIDPNKRDT